MAAATGEPAPANYPTNATTGQTNPALTAAATTQEYTTSFKATQGWYITAAIVVAVSLGNTKAGPILLGVLGVGLLYQINLLIQGK